MATTSAGREVFQDENGENYSEKTITFETKYGWINIPTVDADGNQMSQAELEEFVEENGPVDPVTGAELPTYDSVDEAVGQAEQRTEDLADELSEEERVAEFESAARDDMNILERAVYDTTGIVGPDKIKAFQKGELPRDEEPEGYNCGGSPMGMFEEFMVGIDPISGNDVPPGSSEINVRDDIPAVLSEGEYVVPADVVRYHGLKTFMALRDEAKMGLMAMHMEGQIKTLEDEEYDEEYDYEYEEDAVHETAEGNEVEAAEHIIEEAEMEYDEEDDEDVYASTNAYKPNVKVAVIRK